MHSLVLTLSFICCSALGAAIRLGLTHLAKQTIGQTIYATLFVNLMGAVCIGVFYVLFQQIWQLDKSWYLVLVAGLLGSLTTFSGFSLEVADMLIRKQWLAALFYSLSSVFFCITVTFLALKLSHMWWAAK